MRVREGFQRLAKDHPNRIKTIDTTKPPAVVKKQAEKYLEEWLKNGR
jgi:thymidylate kinase